MRTTANALGVIALVALGFYWGYRLYSNGRHSYRPRQPASGSVSRTADCHDLLFRYRIYHEYKEGSLLIEQPQERPPMARKKSVQARTGV